MINSFLPYLSVVLNRSCVYGLYSLEILDVKRLVKLLKNAIMTPLEPK